MDEYRVILEGLNPQQKEAVTHGEGPLLIIAGAGTGKTTVITHRIAYLIYTGKAKSHEILALTFTDKAAQEMEERVDLLVPYGYTDIWISTFHAFGDRVLRENAVFFGLKPDFKVLNQAEAAVFLRQHLFEFELSYFRPLTEPTRYINSLISIFSRLRDDDILPQEYLKYVQKLETQSENNPQDEFLKEYFLQQKEIALAYKKYLELLEKEGQVDFANQFYLVLKLFRQYPLILKKYQDKFKYILIDEFQDTNFAQYRLAHLLAGLHQNIAVVADDDQCIYRWRGAAYSNVLSFINDFPQAKKINLLTNYRSNQNILDSAYQLIQHNNPDRFEVKANINKRLIALKQGPGPQCFCFDTYLSEADFVVNTIKEKVLSGGLKYSDFAILVRSNSDAKSFLESLNMVGIPFRFSGGQGLYQLSEIKLCIHFLKFIASVVDSSSVFYLVSSELYAMDIQDLALCLHYAKRHNQPLYYVFKDIQNIAELNKGIKQDTLVLIERFVKEMDKFLELSRTLSAGRLLYAFLKDTGYLKMLLDKPSLDNELKIKNIARFFNIVHEFEIFSKDNHSTDFINYLELLLEAGDDPAEAEVETDIDAVNVLTVHKAKGLEFKVVFMVNLVAGKFPLYQRSQPIEIPLDLIKEVIPEGDFHLQEERRLFYVAMTRAKDELYFTWAQNYGGSRNRKVSQFVIEAAGEEVLKKEKKITHPLEKIARFDSSSEKSKVSILSKQDQLLTLSYFQIDDYLTCPMKYKYVHILRIPIMEHHTVLYGRAMHEAVSRYLRYRLANIKVEPDFIIKTFEEVFQPEGFLSKQHQQERERIAKKALLDFYYSEEKNSSLPTFIEKEFSFIYENNRIIGRFDRLDIDSDNCGVITDFKSSQVNSQQEADKRTRESLQLMIYSLAYKEIFGQLPKEVRLYFLESLHIGRTVFSEKDLEKAKQKIKKAAQGIREQIFTPKPDYMVCLWCAYNLVCKHAILK